MKILKMIRGFILGMLIGKNKAFIYNVNMISNEKCMLFVEEGKKFEIWNSTIECAILTGERKYKNKTIKYLSVYNNPYVYQHRRR